MSAGQESAVHRLGGPRGLVTGAGAALALTWRAGPAAFVCQVLLTVVQGLLPAGVTCSPSGSSTPCSTAGRPAAPRR
ncbi:hypothetical protein ACWC1D_21230 [Streptomyces sp. NPDC001478]